ncbi:MAG: BREX system P-loop protein BrxC, partial [Saprospiraceae bacterium]|nr:BREX system P-loop protein BrxC [Saprospiraceae bacterium]
NQVWIACTAQQTLDEVSQGTDGKTRTEDEFGKILGRFDTRISLQSNDAAFITQKRVLDKNSAGLEVLGKLYRDKKEYILNQFKIAHDLYKGYQTEDEFVLAYPFVPYQFKLIAHVFEAFQQLQFVIKEVKDNERSVLGITHFTIKEHASEEVGGFIPLDAFYNGMFQSNLTHRGARAIQNGLELDYVKKDAFAQRVVKALFMVSNLLESQRLTFPSNIDNLTVLLMTELDQNKMQLQKKVREVLEKLRDESIVREENGSYFFFNEDEIDVQNLIKNQTLGFDDRLERFDEFFRKMTQIRNKHSFGQNDFRVGYFVDGKEFLRNGEFDIKVLLTDPGTAQQKALDLNKTDLGICVNEWFLKDVPLRKDFEWYCQTLKFFSSQGDSATGVRAKTIENFRIRNGELEKSISLRLKQHFAETRFISQQRVVEPDQVNGTDPVDRTKNILDKHLEGIYHKHQLAANYAQNQKDLKMSAAGTQGLMHGLSPAEELVNNMISNYNNQVTVHDLINELEKVPFGWRHEAVLDVLVHLVKKKKREFRYRNQPRYPIVDFINKAVSAPERQVCEVCSGQEIDQATIDETAFAFRDIFNRDLIGTTDGNELYQLLLEEFKKEQAQYLPLEDDYHGTYPFGNCFHETSKMLNRWANIRDPKSLFDSVRSEKETAKAFLDLAKGMKEFVGQHIKEYDAIGLFYKNHRENILELDIDVQEKADKIKEFLHSEDPRSDYRHIRKAYDEVKTALTDYKKQLTDEVVEGYEQVFAELEAEKTKLGVTEANVYADHERTLQGIRNLDSIAQLKNRKLEADHFKAEQLEALIRYAAAKPAEPGKPQTRVGEPKEYYITRLMTTISNEQELDDYLAKARKEMLDLLHQNKTIILK